MFCLFVIFWEAHAVYIWSTIVAKFQNVNTNSIVKTIHHALAIAKGRDCQPWFFWVRTAYTGLIWVFPYSHRSYRNPDAGQMVLVFVTIPLASPGSWTDTAVQVVHPYQSRDRSLRLPFCACKKQTSVQEKITWVRPWGHCIDWGNCFQVSAQKWLFVM